MILTDLAPERRAQGALFPVAESEGLMEALDRINAKYGRHTLYPGAIGLGHRPWHTRFARRTPRYTTRGDELLTVG